MQDNRRQNDDRLIRMASKSSHVSFSLVEATGAARQLSQRHLAGPCASKALAEGLVAAALLSANIKNKGECISFQLQVSGPLGGIVTEASEDGGLRGFVYKKLLPEFDVEEDMELSGALGKSGSLTVIQSSEQAVIYSGNVAANPPSIQHNLARYCNTSLQTPAGAEILCRIESGYVACARGLLVEKLHDCTSEIFVGALEKLHKGDGRAMLAEKNAAAHLAEVFGFDDLEVLLDRPLRFSCRCSRERVLGMISALEIADLRDMAASEEAQEITCHFCGTGYQVSAAEVREILKRKEN